MKKQLWFVRESKLWMLYEKMTPSRKLLFWIEFPRAWFLVFIGYPIHDRYRVWRMRRILSREAEDER